MKKVAIIFHSVCGNTYLIAKEYSKFFKNKNIACDIFKVKDTSFESLSKLFNSSLEYREEIKNIPEITNPKILENYDAIFMGSPTYFGSVSHQMKEFMDSFIDLWLNSNLKGKYFSSFSTAGDLFGGATLTLKELNNFSQHMGMINISVPPIDANYNQPAYGITHIVGNLAEKRITNQTKKDIYKYLTYFINTVNF